MRSTTSVTSVLVTSSVQTLIGGGDHVLLIFTHLLLPGLPAIVRAVSATASPMSRVSTASGALRTTGRLPAGRAARPVTAILSARKSELTAPVTPTLASASASKCPVGILSNYDIKTYVKLTLNLR